VRATKRRAYRLSELLEKVTSKNLHGEVDTNGPMGREVW
jgi:antitoxin component of MazEF toxin-antitoxin module